jgi:thiamine-monophosphate kinase
MTNPGSSWWINARGAGQTPYGSDVRESQLLEYIVDRAREVSERYEQVLVGPGHDCAVISISDGLGGSGRRAHSLLMKVDQLIEGRHFTSDTPAALIGRKALARPLSDIAASAGSPLCALVAATLPTGGDDSYERARELVDAMHVAGSLFNCPVVGGDIATRPIGEGGLQLSVTVVGTPHPLRGPVLRSGVKPGDFIYVTGSLGGSFRAEPDHEFGFAGGGKHLTFTPRLAEATWLADALDRDLRAMMDVSDGLGRDCARLAKASNVMIEIDAEAIPVSPEASGTRAALSDGEDYELLFASPRAPMPAGCGPQQTPIRLIGVARAREHENVPYCTCRWPDGRVEDVGEAGWDHT